jgi:hypothetical protein
MKPIAFSLLLLTAVGGSAQSWSAPYLRALDLAKKADWPAARQEFQRALELRAKDESGPIRLPSPITDPVTWRGGAPYSPRFGAAYCLYRLGLSTADNAERSKHLLGAVDELEEQIRQSGVSLEALYVLDQAWFLLRNADKRREVQSRRGEVTTASLKIDGEILDESDRQSIAPLRPSAQPAEGAPAAQVNAADINPAPGNQLGPALTITPVIRSKYALVIGNVESLLPEGRMESAAADAALVQTGLVQFGGYDPANVELLTNATSEQIRSVAAALAQRMEEDGTVFLYFAGVGVNLGGRDWLAGVDASFAEESSAMVSKSELIRTFARRGARVFSFYQVDRPVRQGFYFGREPILDAAYSQMNSTIEGGRNFSLVQAQQRRGVFASAIHESLRKYQGSQGRIPIWAFSQTVISNVAGGEGSSGSSPQTPTYPWLNFLTQTSTF